MPITPEPDFEQPTRSSSLVALYASMQRWFEQQVGDAARVYLGLRYRDNWDTSRVVIIDGEFDGAGAPKPRAAGRFRAPWQKQSYNPRELVGWERPITLSIRGVDATNPDSEAAQIQATEDLIELTVQAVHNAMAVDSVTGANVPIGQNNVDWTDGKGMWVDPGSATQQTWGKEFLIGLTYKCPLFDVAQLVVVPSPMLQKGPLLSTQTSGVNASVIQAYPASGAAVISNLGFCNAGQVGMSLVLSGAASSANNGTFPIAALMSSTSLVIANSSAVAPDANNGAIAWQIVPPS